VSARPAIGHYGSHPARDDEARTAWLRGHELVAKCLPVARVLRVQVSRIESPPRSDAFWYAGHTRNHALLALTDLGAEAAWEMIAWLNRGRLVQLNRSFYARDGFGSSSTRAA
jgi:hypothetical protein